MAHVCRPAAHACAEHPRKCSLAQRPPPPSYTQAPTARRRSPHARRKCGPRCAGAAARDRQPLRNTHACALACMHARARGCAMLVQHVARAACRLQGVRRGVLSAAWPFRSSRREPPAHARTSQHSTRHSTHHNTTHHPLRKPPVRDAAHRPGVGGRAQDGGPGARREERAAGHDLQVRCGADSAGAMQERAECVCVWQRRRVALGVQASNRHSVELIVQPQSTCCSVRSCLAAHAPQRVQGGAQCRLCGLCVRISVAAVMQRGQASTHLRQAVGVGLG